MSEIFTYKWTGTNGEKPVSGSLWIDFINSLSQQEIERGIALIIETFEPEAWPPSIIEFKNLCNGVTPIVLGLPDIDQAFNQALAGKYKLNKVHDVVRVASEKTGIFDLQRGVPTDTELKKRFAYNYHIIVDRYAKNQRLEDEVNKALEHIVTSPTKGCNDDLIEQGIQAQRERGKGGYKGFLEAKQNLRGRE